MMIHELSVSIVIPTYNQAQYLKICLQSILDQTRPDWEVIIVNNFSNDDTIDVVQSMKDERFTLVNFANKGIIGAARNEGVRHARAELIAFLDSDDWWETNKLEIVLNYVNEHADVDLVCHDEWLYARNKKTKVLKYGAQFDYKKLLFKGNALSTSAVTLKKNSLLRVNGFSEEPCLAGVEDYDLWLRLARKSCKIVFLHDVLGYFRIHDDSFSAKIEKHCAHVTCLFDRHFRDWQPKNIYYRFLMRNCYANANRMCGKMLMKNGDPYRQVSKYLRRAISYNPFSWKAWVHMCVCLGRLMWEMLMRFRHVLAYSLPFLLGLKRCRSVVNLLLNNSLSILLYHDIPNHLFDSFRAQMQFLQKHYQLITPNEFEQIARGDKTVVGHQLLLSFDDGFKSNFHVAKEILTPLNIKALFFVPPSFVDCADRVMQIAFMQNRLRLRAMDISGDMAPMSWDDLRWLIRSGHTIGSHTMTHACLSKIISPEELFYEVAQSKKILEAQLQQSIEHFAYPLGDVDSINSVALSLALKHYRYVYSGVRGNYCARSRVFYRESMDLGLGVHYARFLAEGGLRFHYRRAREN